MSVVAVIQGDLQVNGTVSANVMSPSDGSVTNVKISASAALPIDADKLEFIHKVQDRFGLSATTAPSADVEVELYTAKGVATIRSFRAKLLDCGTTTDVKFDLKKAVAGSTTRNSVLSAVVAFTHSDTNNTAKSGTISSSTLAAGDTLFALMDYTSATGASGPIVYLEVDEAAN